MIKSSILFHFIFIREMNIKWNLSYSHRDKNARNIKDEN